MPNSGASASHLPAAAFWDEGRAWYPLRATEVGDWDYRVSGNLQRFENQAAKITATAIEKPRAPVSSACHMHHFATLMTTRTCRSMGPATTPIVRIRGPRPLSRQVLEARAKQKSTTCAAHCLAVLSTRRRFFPSRPGRTGVVATGG